MGFLDELKSAAGSVAKEVTTMGNTAAIKAKEKSSVFKLKKQIEDIELEINKTYKEIGMKVVDEFRNSSSINQSTLQSLIGKIDNAKAKIISIELEIQKVEAEATDNITEMKTKM